MSRNSPAATGSTGPGRLEIRGSDLRSAITQGRESNLVLLVVDASGSMAARSRMAEVKTAVLSLLMDAYQRRDRVGLVTFRGAGAQLALPPTSSVEAAAACLAELPHGGRTPLAEGLTTAAKTLGLERIRDPRRRALLVLVTDGRATAGAGAQAVAARQRSGSSSRVMPRRLTRLPGLPVSSSTLDMRRRMRGLLRARQISRSASHGKSLTRLARSYSAKRGRSAAKAGNAGADFIGDRE